MKYIAIIFLLIFTQVSYSQGGDKSHGRSKVSQDALVSVFIPIEVDRPIGRWAQRDRPSTQNNIIGFQLKYYDVKSKLIWESKASIIDYDSSKYLVKTDIPEFIRFNTDRILCVARMLDRDRDSTKAPIITTMQYGGVTLSSIRLNIASKPQGAETFLVPNRIWNKTFAGKKLENMAEQLATYRVNPTFTSTHVFIDETVYTIVCKIGSKYSTIRHNTAPMNVSKEQSAIVPFEK